MDPRDAAPASVASGLPPEPGAVPPPAEPDPAPERDLDPPPADDARTELGEPIGADTIREGRVGGVIGTPRGTHGEGQGG